MHFVISCVDKAGSGQVRADNRAAHLDYLNRNTDKILAAGPTLSEDGAAMNGSVLILEFADRAEAEAFAAGDPYAQAGLFESVTIRPWKKVFPAG
jgi:uncharacterized protein YciI